MEKIVRVDNISKKFGKREILKNVSFEIGEGEILGFIGPNGAGKTTTIKMMLGLQTIDKGSVTINGFDVKNDYEKAIERVGAIVESPDLYMYMSGRKNLELIVNMYKDIPLSRVDEVVKITGLENRINDKVSKYSLGMRQRLGIAAALINKPNVLILDEPTNGLDPEGIKDLRELMLMLAKKEKIAILISSHNLAELESFCTDVCIIKNGVIMSKDSIAVLKKGKKTKYTIEVNDVKKALEVDERLVEVSENLVQINCNKEEIPKVIKELADKVDIYEVKLYQLSLEEAFLIETGGNVID